MSNTIKVYYVAGGIWDKDTQSWTYMSEQEAIADAMANISKNIGGNRGKGINRIYMRKSAAEGTALQNIKIWPKTKIYELELSLGSFISYATIDLQDN